MQDKKLEKYCKSRLLKFEIEDGILTLGEEAEFEIVESDILLFNNDMEFLPVLVNDVDGWVYEFGGRWYLQSSEEEELQLKELVYYGEPEMQLPTPSFLGIHSGYELMNGMGLYSDWIKKAKFLGTKALGICEKSTLSGVLVFQNLCERNGIKSIIGETLPIAGESDFEVKVYAKDFQGWQSLLKFNSMLNIDKVGKIALEELLNNLDGLYLVVDPKSLRYAETVKFSHAIDFYQLDTVVFLNEDIDSAYIDNLESYLKSDLSPISISDAYYLEQDDYVTRESLWTVAKAFDDKTNNQYFKSRDQYAKELIVMFEGGNKTWVKLFKQATSNEDELVANCNFKYDTDTRHLPKYEMTKVEAKSFATNEALFINLITEGFKSKGITEQKYVDRVKKEIEVLKMGDVIDYFLILHDIVKHARSEGMLTGIGRGSAGGSLVAYLLNIIHVDPLEFDLLFERFLNSGRMGAFEDRPYFEYEDKEGNVIGLAEGQLAKVKRNGNIINVYCDEIVVGDEIIKH